MPMIDTFKYEQLWYVHDEDEYFTAGDEFQSLESAMDSAKQEAEYHDHEFIVTEVFIKPIKRTKSIRSVEIEDF